MAMKPKGTKSAAKPAAGAAKPKFGSPEWNAKYGVGKGKKGK